MLLLSRTVLPLPVKWLHTPLFGDEGDDFIAVRDNLRDTLYGGAGTDRAQTRRLHDRQRPLVRDRNAFALGNYIVGPAVVHTALTVAEGCPKS